MRPTMSVRRSTVVLASSRMRANTPAKSPCMRVVRSPLAIACNTCDTAPRLLSELLIR